MPATIAFDLDGTLVDSVPDMARAVNLMLAEEAKAPLSLEKITSFVGNGLPHLVKLVIEASDLDMARHDALVARVLAHYLKAESAYTTLYPKLRAALDKLVADGHRLTLCTNKPEVPARHILAHFELDDLFETLVCGDTLPTRKPDPAMLHAALGDTGPYLFVGDSDVDAETAQRAGVPFLLFTEGYCKVPLHDLPHAALFNDYSQLPALVAKVLADG